MRLLVTGGDSPLARALYSALAGELTFRAVDARYTAPLPSNVERLEGDLRDPDFTAGALEDVEAVLHLAPLFPPPGDDSTRFDHAARGTYVLANAAAGAGAHRILLGSTLGLFDRFPASWRVTESWRPRPRPRAEDLGPWLAELSLREGARALPLHALCLRFGRIVDTEEARSAAYDPLWLHLDDAVEGVRRALEYRRETAGRPNDWRIFHLTAAGSRAKVRLAEAGNALGYQPAHDFRDKWPSEDARPDTEGESSWREVFAPTHPIPSRPVRKVVVFGAGGPLASETARELASSYVLRLTDVRPLEEIAAEGKPQSPGAPLPTPLGDPHECRVVDVTNAEEVLAACEGMDAILNCTVIREDPVEAFRVNMLGAYHIAQAAVAHRIRRVVQTGPQQVTVAPGVGYEWDYDVTADAPPRPGAHLYSHSKYLGQEIMRVFADEYDLEIPVLLYTAFVNPETARPGHLHPFSISWRDGARSLRRALETAALPSPCEVFNITADLPHGRYSNRKAKELLVWQPRENFERLWMTSQE
ncbi:MAG: NAD-dependent epimerase/dehydratase family protein [Armatimonadetes bacterium]|nr:NAD-dependent epimerase/dehydratase family protein [Armatimonadota bacterium]